MSKIEGGATIWARQTIESDIFLHKPDKWFKIWFYIINKVRYKKMDKFNRGQNFIKYEWISSSTGATKSQIDHFIRWAKEAQMLATQKATRGMVVNVLKYEIYQDLSSYESDTKSDTRATQERHKSDTILKKEKKEKESKNIIEQSSLDKRNLGIEFIYKIFEEEFGNKPIAIKGKNGFDLNRGAAKRLYDKHGEKIGEMLKFVFLAQKSDQYCRTTINPLEFEKNLDWYKVYFKKKQSKVADNTKKSRIIK